MGRLHKIYPIPVCNLTMDKGLFTYLKYENYGVKVTIPAYVWLIEGGAEPILVDTGCVAEDFLKETVFTEGAEDIISVEAALQNRGISMADIKTIIITHLDIDHILNARKFPKARFILQEEEYRFAMNPHPMFARKYHQHLYHDLNFEMVRGDSAIIPGVEVIFTPGHAAGGQSVAVTTEQGKVVIAGFCAIDENFSPQGDIIPGMHIDPLQAYDSLVRIRKIADMILPLHSQRLAHTESIP